MNRQGTQGIHDAASNGALDSEFGTHKEEDVIKQILEKGTVQETEVSLPPHGPHSYPILSYLVQLVLPFVLTPWDRTGSARVIVVRKRLAGPGESTIMETQGCVVIAFSP